MRDLPDHTLWHDDLLTSCDLQLGAKVVDALVSLHSSSHVTSLGQAGFSQLKEKFSPLPKLTEFQYNHTFVKPLLSTHRDNKPCDEKVRVKVDELIQDAVVTKAIELANEWLRPENATCLIHGDMYSAAVLANRATQNIKIIDTECARIGPEALDVARLVCNYVLFYHYHHQKTGQGSGPGKCDHTQLMADTVDLICITLSRYMEGMRKALQENFDKHLVWKQILLFMGIEIIAWISGPMSLACLESFPEAQIFCLNTALRLLHRQTLSLDARGVSQLIHDSH
ncbi:methylthioribose kinase [Plakobranchus ocellatus]|uniref:Methylthioribose kinase n=1 Tax=Plakobranchus ocellatus TaxID=259542 RepID=A0AAV4D256_9GAST|nr:methylthioribose kinase [Plakobranchus ocellatus]